MSEEKLRGVQWIQDSGGAYSCHINDGSLNFQQSLIGRLSGHDDTWHAILLDGSDLTPDGVSLLNAHNALEFHFNKNSAIEKVETPDRTTPRIAQKGHSGNAADKPREKGLEWLTEEFKKGSSL